MNCALGVFSLLLLPFILTAPSRTCASPVLLGDENSTRGPVEISLTEETFKANGVVFTDQYELLANSSEEILVKNHLNIPEKYFYYLQLHAFVFEIELRSPGDVRESGTHLGHIFWASQGATTSFRLNNRNENQTVALMIILLAYEKDKTPIPGACATNQKWRPALNVTTLEDFVSVSYAPGRLPGTDTDCGSSTNQLLYDVRYVYMGKTEPLAGEYFETITKLLAEDTSLNVSSSLNGVRDPERPYQRMFSRYAGMRMFFVVVLRDSKSNTTIPINYIPSSTSGCPVSEVFQCELIENNAWKLICVAVILIGIAIIVFGRGILFTRVSVYSFFISGILIYAVHSLIPFDHVLKLTFAVGFGIALTLAWVRTLMRCHAIYRLSDLMAGVILGYIFTCIIMYGVADAEILVNSVNYFSLLLTGVFLLTLWHFSLLSVCRVVIMNVVVGSTFVVLALSFIFEGGNLQYAFVNNWRRIRDNDFRFALSFPHLEAVDWISIALWVIMFSFGLCFHRKCQFFSNTNRRQGPRIFRDPEQRPLIANFQINSGDSSDVFLSPRSNSRFLSSIGTRENR